MKCVKALQLTGHFTVTQDVGMNKIRLDKAQQRGIIADLFARCIES